MALFNLNHFFCICPIECPSQVDDINKEKKNLNNSPFLLWYDFFLLLSPPTLIGEKCFFIHFNNISYLFLTHLITWHVNLSYMCTHIHTYKIFDEVIVYICFSYVFPHLFHSFLVNSKYTIKKIVYHVIYVCIVYANENVAKENLCRRKKKYVCKGKWINIMIFIYVCVNVWINICYK